MHSLTPSSTFKVAFLLAGVIVLAAVQENPKRSPEDDAQALYQQAQGEYTRGDYPAACRDFKRFAERDDSASSWSNYGVACHMAGQAQEAIDALEKALSLDPRLLPANLILGIDYVRVGRPREGVPLFNAVLDQQPDNRDALIDLASAHFALEEFEAAADIFRREVVFRPQDADAWYGIGTSFEHIAEEASRRLSSVPNNDAYFHRLVGRFLLEQGLPLDAEEAFRKALASTSGDDEDLRPEMGFALLLANQLERADQEFRSEIAVHPHSQTAWLGLAGIDFANLKFREAVDKVCELNENDAGFFATHIPLLANSLSEETKSAMVEYLQLPQNVANCPFAASLIVAQLTNQQVANTGDGTFDPLTKTKKVSLVLPKTVLSQARAANEKGRYTECFHDLEVMPLTSVQDAVLLSRCGALAGHFAAAFEAADAAHTQDPASPAVLYWRAESARELAKAAFAKAVSLNPGSWQGQILLGDLYRQSKKWELATSHYSNAIQLKPESPAPHLGLGAIYWETGQFEKAQPELERVLQLDPDNVQAKSELADILVRQHRFEEALPLLLKVAARDPGLLLTHANLSKVYAHGGRFSEAVAQLLLALPSDSQGELHYQLYSLYTKQGKTKEAREALTESESLRALAQQQKQSRTQRSRTQRTTDDSQAVSPP